MANHFLLLRGLAREQGHWGDFGDALLKVPGVDSIHYIDLPGNGKYYKLTSPVSIREMAEFVHSHNPLGKDQPVSVLAVSMGAMIAIELASMYPDRYKRLFLMNTSLSGVSPVYQRLKPKSLETFYKFLRSGTVREREEHIMGLVSNTQQGNEELLESWTRLAHARPTHVTNAFRQLVAAGRYRLPKVKPLTPIYLMASKGDRMVDYRCSVELAKKWDTPIALHDGSGHELSTDAPEWVCEQLKSWLRSQKNEVKAASL